MDWDQMAQTDFLPKITIKNLGVILCYPKEVWMDIFHINLL